LENFLLVTVIGGLFTFFLSALRDDEATRQSRLAATRDLIKLIDELYRATKQIKRTLRSRAKTIHDTREIDADFFVLKLDELSGIQLRIEQARNLVRMRPDLFGPQRQSRILKQLEYSDKYLHDVVEDYEKQTVSKNESKYVVSEKCKNLWDFIGPRGSMSEIESVFREMEKAVTSGDRFAMLESLSEGIGTLDQGGRRRKAISDKCLLLAMREMRDEIIESRPRFSLDKTISLFTVAGPGLVRRQAESLHLLKR